MRDFISYAGKVGRAKILVNRGASGIDGQLASASGAVSHFKKPAILVLGDLSTLHDLNSLFLFTKLKIPVLIVVMNNNGGGIFHHLPYYQSKESYQPKSTYFEKILRTPTLYAFCSHSQAIFNALYLFE